MTVNFRQKLDAEFEKLQREIQKPNVLLIGGTGVGKSSLLNYCFGQQFAKTGIGKPVTQHVEKYQSDEFPTVIYDSKGYEVGKEKEFFKDVIGFGLKASTDAAESIHLAWYCIQANGSRITDFDINAIQKLQLYNIPIAVLLTKSDAISDEEAIAFRQVIHQELPRIAIFETSILPHLDGLELKKLIDWSIEKLPEGLRLAFVAAQKLSLDAKKSQAKKAILQQTAASAVVAMSPIPFSDAPVLVVNQLALVARIMLIYNIGSEEEKLKAIFKTAIIEGALPTVGKYLAAQGAAQLIKFFPGMGTAIGAAINATVASILTFAVGYATSEMCYRILNISAEQGMDGINRFMENFNQEFINLFLEGIKLKGKKDESSSV